MGLKRRGRDLAGNAPVEYLSANVAHALLRAASRLSRRLLSTGTTNKQRRVCALRFRTATVRESILPYFSKPLRPYPRPHPHLTPIRPFEQELIFTHKSEPRLPVEHARFQSRPNRQP